ncbi:ABC-2 transporter permease [Salipaludibacillus sp. CUR1]|uniref:ABC-2 transporter permease n=1 Tax=Salipaludibacillus sp. CUR1 TaxID=2820003 RepID=UPI001E5A88F7|nr:ABC-2 transporter permease [Salipaludibacillus sp. CUR1]MCE7790890.1 ABC-2 transporter permease [Salipaludibacillus sp. CUR1]
MTALLLTSYYLVSRSFFAYTGLAILISCLIFYFGDGSLHGIVALLVILLVSMPALEVVKHEGKSGYDKYVLTLPVSRNNIVQSHYFFYFIAVIIGTFLSFGIFQFYNLVSTTPTDDMLNTLSFGIFIVFFAGAIAYPLLYILGSEKSDAIVLGGGMGGLIVTFGLQDLIGYIIEQPIFLNLNLDSSLLISIIYIMFGIAFYIVSFIISTFIYNKKEF